MFLWLNAFLRLIFHKIKNLDRKMHIAIKISTAFGNNLRPTIKQSTFICEGVFYRPSVSYLEIDDALNIETKL